MNIFLYPLCDALISDGTRSFKLTAKNLVNIRAVKDEVITAYYGANFENSVVTVGSDFCENVAITELYGDLTYILTPQPQRNLRYKRLLFDSIVCGRSEFLITVCLNGGVMLSVDGYKQNETLELPFIPDELSVTKLYGGYFGIVLTKKGRDCAYFAVFSAPNLSCVHAETCSAVDLTSGICVIKKHNGVGRITEKLFYTTEGGVKLSGKAFDCDYRTPRLDGDTLRLAFLEEVRLYSDYRKFLSDELKKDHETVREFFGEFSLIFTPFYKQFENVFAIFDKAVRYVKLDVDDGNICDISINNKP